MPPVTPKDHLPPSEKQICRPSRPIWRWRDLFVDDISGKLSPTKVWTNIGHCALTVGFLRTVWDSALTWDLIMGYGAIVCGNRLGMELIRKRYGGGESENKQSKEDL